MICLDVQVETSPEDLPLQSCATQAARNSCLARLMPMRKCRLLGRPQEAHTRAA